MKARCPKCRSLGLEHDCAEQLIHDKESVVSAEGLYELEVRFTFALPYNYNQEGELSPHARADMVRDTWLSDESELKHVLLEAIEDTYEVTVTPVNLS